MPMFLMLGGFTGEESLVHDGAVGARLIQASTHVRRDGGGAVKLLPSAGDLVYPGRWRFLRLGEEALHGTVLSLHSFWHHSQLSSLVVFVSFHSIVPQVATNRGPVTDLKINCLRFFCWEISLSLWEISPFCPDGHCGRV